MIKVFHIITSLDVGGAERVAINIAKSKNKDIEYHIVEVIRGRSTFTKKMMAELDAEGIRYHRSPFAVPFRFHYIFEKLIASIFPLHFLFLWLKYRPDIIHTHTEMPDMAIWLTFKMLPRIKAKLFRTIHNTKLWSGMDFIGPRVECFMQQRATNISISPNVEQAYSEHYAEHTPIIYNGISPSPQLPYEGIVKGKTNICFAGRFEEQKGISTLCEIIRNLKDDPRYYFHIFGSGRLQYLVDALAKQENVSVNPPLHGISSYLASFDFLIMPSLHEGLSILALEASFNGLPLMINHCAGLYDTLPPCWPLTVTDNDIKQWLHLFSDVLPHTDTSLLKQQAFEFVDSRFSIQQMQTDYESYYTCSRLRG